ncbi:MAG: DUF1015 domain-containing protein [Clostridia bacterium]|nr:DUF1015 domain-containing protein [Clostridia bacterium]
MNEVLKEKMCQTLGIDISSVLLPKSTINMQKWAVVACDQYTSEPEYWKSVDTFVGEEPSTLRLIFPEAYLELEDETQKTARIEAINASMKNYLAQDIFVEQKDTVLLVERTFSSGKKRHGLMLSVDLERYDYSKGSQSLIRATEGTIIERLPPRIRIRENAPLELPHIMILIDDRSKAVVELFIEKKSELASAYDFELMQESGHIKAWKLKDEKDIEALTEALLSLADPEGFKNRYEVDDRFGVLLFAVGDGNHSLATAKACWENLKKKLSADELEKHPARYALVEIVNVHDEGLEFEPIHRVLFNVDPMHLSQSFCAFYRDKNCKASVTHGAEKPQTNGHAIRFKTENDCGYLVVENPAYNLEVATLQSFLDSYLKNNKQVNVDYVHGEDVTERLGSQPGNMGFFLSPMDKNELFRTVILDGALPRKTFSMGEASEKRFYLESRKIR